MLLHGPGRRVPLSGRRYRGVFRPGDQADQGTDGGRADSSRPACAYCAARAALAAAQEAGLVGADDAGALRSAWLLSARIRDAVMLVRGRASDTLPAHAGLAAVARVLGYPPDAAQDLVQDYRRGARRARAVMERLFYG